MSRELKWIWLAEKCGAGSSELLRIIDKLGSINDIFDADYDAYCEAGVSERLCEDLCDKDLGSAVKILSYCQSAGVTVLTYDSDGYPASLRNLKDPPAVLYCVGELKDFNKKLCISVVGTRTMSEYGMRAAYKIAYEVAASGAVVVSGMALGIDGIASSAAIAAHGKTVAVLGCGIDIVYPKAHKTLADAIRRHGAIITEFPPSTEPRGMNFPIRNRIISGLSQGTVVVDAAIDSGALITAKTAILQGRDIYAVPANIDSENSSGTNSLIRDGAQAVLCGNDVIRNYMYIYRDRLNSAALMRSDSRSEIDFDFVRRLGVSFKTSQHGTKKTFAGGEAADNKPSADKKNTADKKSSAPKARADKAEAERPKPETAPREMPEEKPERSFAPTAERKGDNSAAVLEKLSEKQRRIFDEMPLDRAVTVDYLTKTGFALGEVISALTVLEIKGLVSSLPGALYVRK